MITVKMSEADIKRAIDKAMLSAPLIDKVGLITFLAARGSQQEGLPPGVEIVADVEVFLKNEVKP